MPLFRNDTEYYAQGREPHYEHCASVSADNHVRPKAFSDQVDTGLELQYYYSGGLLRRFFFRYHKKSERWLAIQKYSMNVRLLFPRPLLHQQMVSSASQSPPPTKAINHESKASESRKKSRLDAKLCASKVATLFLCSPSSSLDDGIMVSKDRRR